MKVVITHILNAKTAFATLIWIIYNFNVRSTEMKEIQDWIQLAMSVLVNIYTYHVLHIIFVIKRNYFAVLYCDALDFVPFRSAALPVFWLTAAYIHPALLLDAGKRNWKNKYKKWMGIKVRYIPHNHRCGVHVEKKLLPPGRRTLYVHPKTCHLCLSTCVRERYLLYLIFTHYHVCKLNSFIKLSYKC